MNISSARKTTLRFRLTWLYSNYVPSCESFISGRRRVASGWSAIEFLNRGFECFLGPRSRDLFDDCLWIIFRSFQRDPREINEERPAPFLSTGNAGLVLFFYDYCYCYHCSCSSCFVFVWFFFLLSNVYIMVCARRGVRLVQFQCSFRAGWVPLLGPLKTCHSFTGPSMRQWFRKPRHFLSNIRALSE